MIQGIDAIVIAAIGALGVIVGAAFSAVVMIANGWRQRVHESKIAEDRNLIQIREKIRETALTIALKEWEVHLAHTKAEGGTVYGPYAYIFLYHKILTLMEDNQLSAESIAQVQKEMIAVSEASQDVYDRYRKENKP